MIIETALIMSFATWLGGKLADKGFDLVYDKLTKKNDFDLKFNAAIENVCLKLERKYPDVLGNSISYFFSSQETFDELCKLLFTNQIINIDIISRSFDSTTLPPDFILEFLNELKVELTKDEEFRDILVDKELFIAVQGISKNIEDISNNSNLTLSEVREIRAILEKQFRDRFDLKGFKELYLKNLKNNVGEINFIGLGIDPSIKKGKRKELDSIFIKPIFKIDSLFHINLESASSKNIESSKGWDTKDKLVTFQNLFDRNYNYVILGNPGSGKSLLIKSIILYISQASNQFSNSEILSYIPFRVELKNYLSFKKVNGGNILKYLSILLEEEYSMPNVLEENLSDILSSEKVIVFFDGLDEIFDVIDKISVKNDIENFHNRFSMLKSFTTSRYIGYNDAKLDEEKFCELNLQSFSEEQIKEYVSKWYLLEEENEEVRQSEILDFYSKMSNVDNELLSNPLMLSLIVILYRNNLKIPDSKLEIYQSCTNTLVDKWDASKNLDIHIDKNILLKKEPIFSDLAFWQYETLSSQNTEITFSKARTVVAKSLVKKNVADEDNSMILASSFLEYAHKRSIYFDNNFTHKTFLEYYTAYWIYSNIEMKHKIAERNSIIGKYISNPFWSIVLELLLIMIDKDQPDSEILDSIIRVNINKPNSFVFLVYILPKLKNISPEIQNLVYNKSIIYMTDFPKSEVNLAPYIKDLFNRIQINSTYENQNKIINEIVIQLDKKFWSLHFFIFINELLLFPPFGELEYEFTEVKNTLEYKKILKMSPYVYQLNYYRFTKDSAEKYVELTLEYIDLFGVDEILLDRYTYYDNVYLEGFINIFIFHQLRRQNIYDISKNINMLSNKNLDITKIISHLLDKRSFIILDDESLIYLLDSIDNNVTSKIEKVLFSVILKLNFTPRMFMENLKKINEYNLPVTTSDMFSQLMELNDNQSIINLLFNFFEINDSKLRNQLVV